MGYRGVAEVEFSADDIALALSRLVAERRQDSYQPFGRVLCDAGVDHARRS
jgi:hypothetical protein